MALEQSGDLKIRGVGFRYVGPQNSQLVLDDVSLTIPKGKIRQLWGASGSGKTTLLKTFVTVLRATERE